jgi:hypothetical protein
MELPFSSSDSAVAYACDRCLGNGGFGLRKRNARNPHQPCPACGDTGWMLVPFIELTPEQAEIIRKKVAEIPPDIEEQSKRNEEDESLLSKLSGITITSVSVPENSPAEIHLHDSNGLTRRLSLRFMYGKPQCFQVDIIPTPEHPPTEI